MPLTQLEDTITKVVDDVGPSIVTISTVQIARDAYLRPFPIEGMGSGIILSSDGLLVTNHHVVRGARHAEVALSDGRRLEAEILREDPDADLALLRVNADGLPPAALGDSDRLRVGQLAIAIGSPFGQYLNGPTVTVGVVSALHRNLAGPGGVIEDLIQSDAPINPGNSGGALLDSEGRVMGINTAIIPQAQGIGFAVPVNRVTALVAEAEAGGRVARPTLGVGGITLNRRVAQEAELPIDAGVGVLNVQPGSPAAKGGLRPRDVIVSVDGDPLRSVVQLRSKVGAHRPGDTVKLRVRRGDGERDVAIVLERR